jgi:hypothetical protein
MVSNTRKVQDTNSALTQADLDALVAKLMEKYNLPPEQKRTSEPKRNGRRYPGEAEAGTVLWYIGFLARNPAKQKAFLRPLKTLQKIEAAVKNRDVNAVHCLRRAMRTAYEVLQNAINEKKWGVGVTNEGLIVRPATIGGEAALAVLLLSEKRRLTRIRSCLHCRRMFFARFKSQNYCNDPKSNCQWAHYHTPEWRRKNREHQRQYRDRVFGKQR